MRGRQPNILGVVHNAKDERRVRDEGQGHPSQIKEIRGPPQQLPVESNVDGAHGLVAVADQEAADAVDDKADDGQDAERPVEADGRDHGVGA